MIFIFAALLAGTARAEPPAVLRDLCVSRITVEKAVSDPEFGTAVYGLIGMNELARPFQCRALVSGRREACAPLAAVPERYRNHGKPFTIAEACELQADRMRAARALLRGDADAEALCWAVFSRTLGPGEEKAYRVFCGGLPSARGEEEALCRRAVALHPPVKGKTPSKVRSHCARTARWMRGDDSCEMMEDPWQVDECRAAAAYKRASASGRAEDCGGNAFCLALMGERADCGALEEDARRTVCAAAGLSAPSGRPDPSTERGTRSP